MKWALRFSFQHDKHVYLWYVLMLICYKVISKLVNIYQAFGTSIHLTKNGLLINLIINFEIEISKQLKQHKKYVTSKKCK
jgi:hypothetical protein